VWGLATAAGIALVVGLTWWAAVGSAPICERALVNGRLETASAPIPGVVSGPLPANGAFVRRGDVLARIVNAEIDHNRLDALRDRLLSVQGRAITVESSLTRSQAEHDRLAKELGEQPPAPEAEAKRRLRDEFAARLVELQGTLDDLKARRSELEQETATEERRLAQLREATVTSPVDGVVVRSPDPQRMVSTGSELFAIVDASALVIDAELPGSLRNRVQGGDAAQVRFGTSVLTATVRVVDPGPAETARLAQQVPTSAGAVRVLLDVVESDRAALGSQYSRQPRVAIPGTDPGWLTRLGLALRF
jgi:multidrug resistance efflux pump